MLFLIPRRDRFCQAFGHDGGAATAASAAGYAPISGKKQGWRLSPSPRIQARIREVQAGIDNPRDAADAAIIAKLEVADRHASAVHRFYAAALSACRLGPGHDHGCGRLRPLSHEPSQKHASPDTSHDAARSAVRHGREMGHAYT